MAAIVDLAPEQWGTALAAMPPSERAPLEALIRGPDPQGALRRALQLPAALFDTPWSPTALRLLHEGSYPPRLFAAAPKSAASLTDGLRPRSTPELLEELRGTSTPDPLATIRHREFLRLAALELEGSPLEPVGRGLSDLAEACIQYALESNAGELAQRIVVFGMGKLAGHELNFFSDIDLVFFHQDETDQSPSQAHRLRARIHSALRKTAQQLEASTRGGPLFRVDLRLRPFGSRGPLSLSLGGAEDYYARHGRDWERQVWIRARPIAGSMELGELLLKRLTPFVYRRSLSQSIFEEIATLMERGRREGKQSLGSESVDVKYDIGGIREIEFFVQALQLLHGGKDPTLRTPSTLTGLDRLAAAGHLSDREHRVLSQAYRRLRSLEHHVQIAEGQQSHRLPDDEAQRGLFAARTADKLGGQPPEVYARECFKEVLAVTNSALPSVPPPELAAGVERSQERHEWALSVALDGGASPRVQQRALVQLGLRDPAEGVAQLQYLYSRPEGAITSRGHSSTAARQLLRACLDSADPDGALNRMVEFCARRPAHYPVWAFLAQAQNAEAIRRIADLFGTSEPLSQGLIGFTNARGQADESLLGLMMETGRRELPDATQLQTGLRTSSDNARARRQSQPDDPNRPDDRLLRFKQRELVRIGIYDLGHQADPIEIGQTLSDLADLLVQALSRELASEFRGLDMRFAVLAVGKYGMQAMDYGSDLDLMFVYRSAVKEASNPALKLGRRLLHRLQERSLGSRLYEVDMRLRPSGNQGLLVSSLPAFEHYHSRALPVWERLALMRLRPVAELDTRALPARDQPELLRPQPGGLADHVCGTVVPTSVFRPGTDHDTIIAEVRKLKLRIERELAREHDENYDVKLGEGGCLELELLTSALQLRAGQGDPQARLREIPAALRYLGEKNWIPSSEARTLEEAYRFQRRLMNRLRMSHGSTNMASPDRIVAYSPRLGALARRMGLADRDTLLSRFLQSRQVVRAAFDRLLPPA